MLRKVLLTGFMALIGSQAFTSEASFVGPFLNFIDAGENNDKWTLTALVIAPKTVSSCQYDSLGLYVGVSSKPICPTLLKTINGQNFWRYQLPFERNENPYTTTYSIGPKGKLFEIFIPAKDSDPHVFFGTCNQLIEAPSTWAPINKKHAENPYHLALLAGDQLYVDKPGVFDIPPIKSIMLGNQTERMKPLTEAQKEEIDKGLTENLLNQYLTQYSKAGFAEFLATVPVKSMADDHEYYDGKGSQNPSLPVLERIDVVADYFYYLFQHHTTKEKYSETGLIGVPSTISPLLSYSYLLKFKTMAFYGLDTRTERTLSQISSRQSRDFMFDQLKRLTQKNIFIITGIPLVYQNLNPIYKIFNVINKTPFLNFFFNKVVSQPESRKNLDITTDFTDGWNFTSHVEERNKIIVRLNTMALSQRANITLLAGDVHSAGAGEVINKFNREVRLRQLTSSAITTQPLSDSSVKFKKFISFFQSPETYSRRLVQRLTGYINLVTGKVSSEIALNNWLDLVAQEGTVYPILWTVDKDKVQNWVPQGWPNQQDNAPIEIIS